MYLWLFHKWVNTRELNPVNLIKEWEKMFKCVSILFNSIINKVKIKFKFHILIIIKIMFPKVEERFIKIPLKIHQLMLQE
jgi:hypothetical protein